MLLFFQFVLLGAVPFPKDVPQLKRLGVGGVITLNEPYETLVPSSLYHVRDFSAPYAYWLLVAVSMLSIQFLYLFCLDDMN